jgi:small ligand-binding sensory domain FIST
MRCASGLSTQHELGPAASELAGDLAAALGGMEPDLVFAFATGHEVADLAQLPGLLQPWLGHGLLIGCNGSGVAGGGREQEDGPALALMAAVLIGVDLAATHLEQATLPPVTAAREAWWHTAGVRPEAESAFTLLADPYSFDIEHCARGLDRAFPGATVIGGQASVAQRGQVCLLAGRDLHHSGALLLSWTGNVALEAVVSQGCRPVGEPLFVTACEGNRIRELDGKSPRQALRDLYAALDAGDRQLFGERRLQIGLALPGPQQPVGPGDFLVRDVIGLDADSGELVIAARPAVNAVVQFQLRDAAAAAADLGRELRKHRDAGLVPPAAALMFTCVARGVALFGVPGHDSGLFRRSFGDTPLAGLFCAGELGPVQSATFLHGYSTVIGLIRPRRP